MITCEYYDCSNLVKPGYKFCSSACSGANKNHRKLMSWFDGSWDGNTAHGLSITVRNYLIETARYCCSSCGWGEKNLKTGRVPLEINHIDGNWRNSSSENLEVLCPNCHSLTPNYKALNTQGRSYRKDYDQFKATDNKPKTMDNLRVCVCGASKEPSAEKCRTCYSKIRSDGVVGRYPKLETMIECVERLGYSAYSRELGVSDNAIRKFFKSSGLDPLPRKLNTNSVY